MDRNDQCTNSSAPITPQKNDRILKCPECFNIPEILKNEFFEYYKYECRNKHSKSLTLKELLDKCSSSEIFYKCSFGNETNLQDKYLLFNFCFKCKKIICSEKKCQIAHEKNCGNNSDNFIPSKFINTLCYNHGEILFFYCPKCDINVCEKCEGHEEHGIKLMSQMKIDEKEIKLYNYKIAFTENYLKYIEKKINQFKIEWKKDFERQFQKFENKIKYFFDKNREQIQLIKSILNTYKIKGNICIENNKNIKKFCKIPEFKFYLPYGIDEKRKYIENFAETFLIKEIKGPGIDPGIDINGPTVGLSQITKVNEKIIKESLNILNQLFEINKIEKEEKIIKAINSVLNDYINKNKIFDHYHWNEEVMEKTCWEIVNILPNL